MINKILFITLSNIGDVILTLPTLDLLRRNFPESKITVMVGPRPREIFENNPNIDRLIVYDKHSRLKEKIKLFRELKRENFDMVIDLRNSLFGALLPVRYKTSLFLAIPRNITHMRDRHLYKIRNPKSETNPKSQILNLKSQTKSLYINPENEEYIEKILKENNIKEGDKIVVIAPGARSHIKRWPKEKFLELILLLMEEFKVNPVRSNPAERDTLDTKCQGTSNGVKVVLAGDNDDVVINKYIRENLPYSVLDLTSKTTLAQLACLLKKARLLITNDSAVLHLVSYLNIPVVAIFGPTNEQKYGPWSENSRVVKKEIFCRPCEKAQCKFGTLECMSLIKAEDVLRQVIDLLNPKSEIRNPKQIPNPKSQIPKQYKRILVVRTDRIGDVLLSTPVIKILREAYPCAYIAMMVNPYAKDIVEGNPYLDKTIIYDKEGKHKSWRRSIKFASRLKKQKFDLALILHPANRVHLITFLAKITKRVGYDRKLAFLLTERIKHTKQKGEKHESEYNLDLLRYLGIEPKDKDLFMPLRLESERWVEELFIQEGINEKDKILAVHPGASCPSKIWPNERFAEACDRLIEKYSFKILIVAGPKDYQLAQKVIRHMQYPAVNLAGRTSVSQLASVLKRCQIFISNDSGPVHIACAVGTPVISIFGRNQRGLSPTRWGPLGKRDKILHKEVGCVECLAHNCVKDFACLKAISVDDVLNAVDSILGN